MLSGWLLLLLGLAVIGHLHAPVEVIVVIGVAWIADTLRELSRQASGHIRIRRLQLDPQGKMIGHDSFGKEYKLQILKGSVVLHHWAWLRLGFDDGLYYVEFIRRRDCRAPTWRRLHLIWRHAV